MAAGNQIGVQQNAKTILESLHAECTKTLGASLDSKFDAKIGTSYAIASDLDTWTNVLSDRKESMLYTSASKEYTLALLSCCQGQYRNGFKGLRLVLELVLQGTYLSASLIPLNEWLSNERDTAWSAITDKDCGVLSLTFCRAFFPELNEHVAAVRSVAVTLYRELSETIHGNVPKHIPLPDQLAFTEPAFSLWHEKARIVGHTVNFTLTMRYIKELKPAQIEKIRPLISDHLSNFEPIRVLIGGPRSHE